MMEVAEEKLVIPLWPDLADQGRGEGVNQHGHISGVSNPCLVVMLPPKQKANGNAVMICPGGGYAILDWESHVTRPGRVLLQEGYAVLGLRYRLAPPSIRPVADAVEDLERAIRMVRAAESPLQVQRLVVMGFSAGAHAILAMLAARATERQSQSGGQPSVPPPLPLPQGGGNGAFGTSPSPESGDKSPHSKGGGNQEQAGAVDGVGLICPWPKGQKAAELDPGPGAPPAFIAATDDDEAAPRAFVADLEMTWRRTGSAVCVARYARGGHLAFNYTEHGPAVDWMSPLLRWMGGWGDTATRG